MQSLEVLQEQLREWYSDRVASGHVSDIIAHAAVCRLRADTADGAFRDFVRTTCSMTRASLSRSMRRGPTSSAACAALFDLIMEGVS